MQAGSSSSASVPAGKCSNKFVNIVEEADALNREGKHQRAACKYREALRISEKTMGRNHFNTGSLCANLATVLHSLGKNEEGVSLMERGIPIMEECAGECESELLAYKVSWGTMLVRLERNREAYRLLRGVMGDCRRCFGGMHSTTIECMYQLSVAMLKLDMRQETLVVVGILVEACRVAKHSRLPESLNHMFQLLVDSMRYQEAMDLYPEALEACTKAFGPTSDAVLYIMSMRMRCLAFNGDTEGAIACANEALEKCSDGANARPIVGIICGRKAFAQLLAGEYNEAENTLTRLLQVSDQPERREWLATLCGVMARKADITNFMTTLCKVTDCLVGTRDVGDGAITAARFLAEHGDCTTAAMVCSLYLDVAREIDPAGDYTSVEQALDHYQ